MGRGRRTSPPRGAKVRRGCGERPPAGAAPLGSGAPGAGGTRARTGGVKARCGSPRAQAGLAARGQDCCVNTVARLMHAHDIRAKTARKFRCTTDSNHDLPVAENVLDRQFDPAAPNEAWVADITYIPTREGWLYLAAVEDLYSRRVGGGVAAGPPAGRPGVARSGR